MIRRLLKRFRRKVPRDVAQAATALMLHPRPGAARHRANLNAIDALSTGDQDKMWFWYAVRDEINRRTGYRHGADVATRYLEDI